MPGSARRPAGGVIRRGLVLATCGIFLSGCIVVPKPFTGADHQLRAEMIAANLYAGVEPVTGALSLHDVMARALKYNLDARVQRLNAVLAQKQIALAGKDNLPSLVADAGYNHRSNISASSSRSVTTGVQSLETSTSTDRDLNTASLQFVWNVLDLGVAYYKAKQQADRALLAAEQVRRIEFTIIQQARAAFWRAIAAQRSLNQVYGLARRTNRALNDSAQISRLQLSDPLVALRYQRGLVEVRRDLEQQKRELETARIELAALIRVPPGMALKLKAPKGLRSPRNLERDVNLLEEMALRRHPELRTQDYAIRIGANEARAAIFEMLPRVDLKAAGHVDSNSFLLNSSWGTIGPSVSWNVFRLLTAPSEFKLFKARDEVEQDRLLALGMAAIARVHVSLADHRNAKRQYHAAARIAQLDRKIARQIRNRVGADGASELDAIRAQLDVVSSQLDANLRKADLQNAAGQLMVSVGVDFIPASHARDDLGSIVDAIEQREARWYSGELLEIEMQQVASN